MKSALCLAAGLTLSVWAFACDPQDPRCKAASELVEVLQYKESVAKLQSSCRTAAQTMEPQTVARQTPARLLGIVKETEGWEQLLSVYERFVEEACGQEDLIHLILAGYAAAWEQQLPGDRLFRAIQIAQTTGKRGLAEDAQAVSDTINEALGPVLNQMEQYARSNYDIRVRAIVTGQALDLDARVCAPDKADANAPSALN